MSWFKKIIALFKSDYVLVYTAFEDEECIKVIGKLNDNGIPYKTKIRGIYADNNNRKFDLNTRTTQYDIFVKKEFEHKGHNSIDYN